MPTGAALLPEDPQFAAKFNRTDFLFDHGLAFHPLFEPAALAELAKRIPRIRDFVYWQNGRVDVGGKWDENPAPRLTLEDTIEGIEHNNSLVILKHAEQDPVYGPVLQEILQRIFSFLSPAAQADIVLGESLIFLNSPRRKTAYHMDLESNFLLQIRGVKLIHVFDRADRNVTPHEELENHCSGDYNGAIYKPQLEVAAHKHRLTPGHGVHFPSTAPHWVENEDDVSISININYDLKSVHHDLKKIYQVNRVMRRFGIEPSAPGTSAVRDMLKRRLGTGLEVVRQWRHPRTAVPAEALAYPQWRPHRGTGE
ncbi:MAG TPA: hypothetical protein VMC02_09490 [Steroidobacteraceae bacterium]|nr:hypothetical protein [Steroidobacteraceae bacterium]